MFDFFLVTYSLQVPGLQEPPNYRLYIPELEKKIDPKRSSFRVKGDTLTLTLRKVRWQAVDDWHDRHTIQSKKSQSGFLPSSWKA